MSEEALVVYFQGQEWKLSAPDDFAAMTDVVHLGPFNAKRAFAAALAITWRGKRRPKVSLRSCNYDIGRFGGEVFDELINRGSSIEEITEAGALAYSFLSQQVVKRQEVRDTADFSNPDEAS